MVETNVDEREDSSYDQVVVALPWLMHAARATLGRREVAAQERQQRAAVEVDGTRARVRRQGGPCGP